MLGEMYTDILNAAQREARLDERRRIHNRLRLQADRMRKYYGRYETAAIWDEAADLALDDTGDTGGQNGDS